MGILSKLVVAVSGTLPYEASQIKKWVEANGGKWSASVKKNADITHLIASKEAWKSATDAVQKAADLGVWIVSYDWLEDSLHRKRKLSEKKYTWEFLRQERRKRKKLKRIGAQADGKRFRDGCVIARELTGSGTSKHAAVPRKPKKSTSSFFQNHAIPDTPFDSATEALKQKWAEREAFQIATNGASGNQAHDSIEIEDEVMSSAKPLSSARALSPAHPLSSVPKKVKLFSSPSPSAMDKTTEAHAKTLHIKDLYHYYLDTTGFEYKIVLTRRTDFSSNGFARYHIGLLESHTKPHTYCTIVQYSPPAKKVPEPSSSGPIAMKAGVRNPLLNFLRRSENSAVQQQGLVHAHGNNIQQTSANFSKVAYPGDVSTPAEPTLATSQQEPHCGPERAHDIEGARLNSLITSPEPSPKNPYKALICPRNSPYAAAWRAFRHAFRDLTLLSWEERFDTDRTVQKARAQSLGIEPFVYAKPEKGLPTGLVPQEVGLFQGLSNSLEVYGESDEGYVRNSFKLPSISHALSQNGTVGAELYREEKERKRKEDEIRVKAEEEEERARKMRGEVKEQKRANFNKPFFNCATGTPLTDAYGRYTRNAPTGGGSVGGRGYSGTIRRSKPFPHEQNE